MRSTTSLHRLAGVASYLLPFSLLRRVANEDLFIPVYHTVSNKVLPHIKHLYAYKSVDQFRADLKFLLDHYTPITLQELRESRQGHTPLPPNAMLLTFDDGLSETFDVIAPLLAEQQCPSTFFLTTAFLDNRQLFYKHKASLLVEYLHTHSQSSHRERAREVFAEHRLPVQNVQSSILEISYHDRFLLDEIALQLEVDFTKFLSEEKPYLTTNQVSEFIEMGFEIGAHSVDHPLYSSISLAEQLSQTLESMHWICRKFSLDSKAFAFPFNDRSLTRDLFDQILAEEESTLFFGTSSMMSDSVSSCYQRTVMESLPIPAKNMIALRSLTQFLRKLMGRNSVERKRLTALETTHNAYST